MANFDLTDAEAILKKYYKPNVVGDVVQVKNAFTAVVPENKGLVGTTQEVPILSGYVQNTSGTASAAFSATYATASTQVQKFSVPPVRWYNRATIDRQAMVLSRNDEGAFLKTATLQIDGALKARAAISETQFFREGWGDIGIIAAGGVSGSTFTLETPQDAVNFEIGMKIVFSDSQASDLLRSATPITVTQVNRTSGLITCDTALATPGGVAGDWVFVYGDRENSATPTRLCVAGLGGFLPVTAPSSSSDNLFGCPRYVDPTRLAGLRYDATGKSMVEMVDDTLALMDQEGASPDTLFIASSSWSQFAKELGTRYKFEAVNLKKSDDLTVGTQGLRLLGANAEVTVIPARKCPVGKMYLLTMDSWELASAGEAIGLMEDDAKMIRIAGDDVYEVRVGGYGNLHTNEPGHNLVVYNVGS